MTAAGVVAQSPPKHIRVQGEYIRLRWLQQIIWSALGAAVGGYMVSAVYYLVTQVRWTWQGTTVLYLKHGWDGLLTQPWWVYARHDLRDCYEAVFATLFIRSVLGSKKYWEKRVGWFRILTSPLLLFIAALPIIVLGIWIVDVRNFSVPGYITVYQALLIGFVAGQVVHRLYAPIGNTVQLIFLEQALPKHRRPRFPLPPTVRERYQWLVDTCAPVHDYGTWFTVLASTMVAVLVALAGYGAYVRLVIAKGH